MKKLLIIIFSILASLILIVAILGMETKYYYESKNIPENGYNTIAENPDFRIRIDAVPNSENENEINIILIIDKTISPIKFETAIINLIDRENFKLQAKKVSATDGFYSWVEEKNGSANSFENLSEPLRIVDKDLKAYFAYTWTFEGNPKKLDQIESLVSLSIKNVEGQHLKIKKTFLFKKAKKTIFRSPIRFH